MAQIIDAPTRSPAVSAKNGLEDDILDLIFKGDLHVGVRTSEDDICGLLSSRGKRGLSRTPVRMALAVLQAQGFVVKQPQVGCVVLPVDWDEVQEIVNLRTGVEERVFESIATPRDGDTAPEHVGEGASTVAAAAGKDPDLFLLKERDFHAHVARIAGFATGASMIRIWGDRFRVLNAERVFNLGKPSLDPDAMHQLAHDHDSIIEAVTERQPQHAREAVASHLEHYERLLVAD
jgi:DNA-binding GntR family transcriptional regulator